MVKKYMESKNYTWIFPNNEIEFDEMFSTEAKCSSYLFNQRWPMGFECQNCGGLVYWKSNRDLYICKGCEHQHSVTAGTILHKTHKPLKLWFKAIWMLTSTKSGVSATNLGRLLGVSYPTAWTWLQKLKRCTINPEREQLSGTVEIDEFYLGGKHSGKQGRGSENKHIVMVAVERRKSEDPEIDLSHLMGRARLKIIPDCSAPNLTSFINDNVLKGSTLITDKWSGYVAELQKDFVHKAYKSNKNMAVLNHAHRITSLVKRWFTGTFQGSIQPEHLQEYLDEYIFRFNRRNFKSIGQKFYRMVDFVSNSSPVRYVDIIEKLE